MRYYRAKSKFAREEMIYRNYTADSFLAITHSLGATGGRRYYEILHPTPVDERDPMVIAKENCEKMGIQVVS